MKNKVTLLAALALASLPLSAGELHNFSKLRIEARSDFDYMNRSYDNDNNRVSVPGDSSEYGFNGKYFNLHVAGEFAEKFSYYFRQRVIAKPGAVSFFDNTDFLWLQYQMNENWAVRAGKDFLRIGGYEYDAAPIDEYFVTNFWQNIACFQLNATLIYTSTDHRNEAGLQVSNSPYVYYAGSGDEWKRGLLGYGLYWNMSYEHFKTLWSVNMFERERGDYVGYIALGNKFEFCGASLYVDYLNRVVNTDKFFADFSFVSRLDVPVGNANIFLKGGIEQNLAEKEDFATISERDITLTPGTKYQFYGLGVEYRPEACKDVRLHAFAANAITKNPDLAPGVTQNDLNVNFGLSFNLDFLKWMRK